MQPLRRLLSSLLAIVLVFAVIPVFSPAHSMLIESAAALPMATLNAVTFVPGSTVVIAVGASGTILRSANDGATWTSVGPGGTYEFVGVSFLDADRGWAITRLGGIFRTTNGGQTWTGPLYMEGQTLYPAGLAYDVAFVESGGAPYGFAAGGRVSSIAGQDKPRVWWRYGHVAGGGQWAQGVQYDPYLNPATGDYSEVYRNGTGELYALDFLSSTVG